MKTLILDEKTWRCGFGSKNPENKRGTGQTCLENTQGYKCCLGQFTKQLTTKRCKILNLSEPNELKVHVPLLNKKIIDDDGEPRLVDTKLSTKAMFINDNQNTTVVHKVKQLKSLFSKRGVKIIFKPIKK